MQHGPKEHHQGVHQRRDRYRLAAGTLHTRRRLRKDAAQGLQSERAALGETGERLDGRAHRPNRQMPLGSAVVPNGREVKTKPGCLVDIRVSCIRSADYLRYTFV